MEMAVSQPTLMNHNQVNAVLNRLLVIHNRSLPMYLSDAVPWMKKRGPAQETLELIVDSHKNFVDRIGSLILENNGEVNKGEFPIQWTALHDLSMDYLVKKLIENQKRDIRLIQQCSDDIEGHSLAKALAEEALGAAKGHLQSLEELR